MKIDNFDRATMKLLRVALNGALAEVGIEGVTFKAGSMSFTGSEATIKVKATTERNAELRTGLVQMWLGAHNVASLTNDDGWALVDYHSRKPKFPFIARDARGKQWKLSPEQARARFGRAA